MNLTIARRIADRILSGVISARGRGWGSTDTLWDAWSALDAAILTPAEEKADFARKDAIFGLIRQISA